MSIVYRSVKGSKLTSDEVDGNFWYLESRIGGQGNTIVTENGFTLLDQELTIAADWVWRIMNVTYTNAAPVVINIPFASSGNQRIDLIVANQSNTFERIAGVESASNPSAPAVPLNKIFVTFLTVTDGVIDEPETPIVGTQFKKKSENSSLKITATGEEIIINLSLGGQMHYIVTSPALISVAGFSPHLLNMGGNPLYPGQDLIFENQTGNPVTLINAHGFAPIKFNEGANIIVPNAGKIWFRINGGFASLMMKSWSEVDLSAKQDKIQQITPVTLLTSGWSLVSGLYQYNYSNVNITTTTIVDVIPDNSTIEIVKNAEILPQTNSSNGSVTLFSKNLPTSNIVVTLNIFN